MLRLTYLFDWQCSHLRISVRTSLSCYQNTIINQLLISGANVKHFPLLCSGGFDFNEFSMKHAEAQPKRVDREININNKWRNLMRITWDPKIQRKSKAYIIRQDRSEGKVIGWWDHCSRQLCYTYSCNLLWVVTLCHHVWLLHIIQMSHMLLWSCHANWSTTLQL